MMYVESCYLCGSSNFRVLFPSACSPEDLREEHIAARRGDITKTYAHNWVKCADCGLVFANPIPDPEQMNRLYALSDQAGYEPEEIYLANTYAKYLQKHCGCFRQKDKALDIGAGNGFFLKVLLDFGFQGVVGVEPSQSACRSAPSDIRPFIKNKPFNEDDFAPNSIDFITCFQTLEHVYFPNRMIESFARILSKDGLFFGVAHNFGTIWVKLMGAKHPIVNAGHFTLFDADTLRGIFSRHFEVLDVFPIYNKYSLNYWNSLLPIPARLKEAVKRSLKLTGIGGLAVTMSLGNIGIFARRR